MSILGGIGGLIQVETDDGTSRWEYNGTVTAQWYTVSGVTIGGTLTVNGATTLASAQVTGNITANGYISSSNYLYAPVTRTALYTVSTLPTGQPDGTRAFVTDLAGTITSLFGTIPSGGGANHAPVWFDGGTWVVG